MDCAHNGVYGYFTFIFHVISERIFSWFVHKRTNSYILPYSFVYDKSPNLPGYETKDLQSLESHVIFLDRAPLILLSSIDWLLCNKFFFVMKCAILNWITEVDKISHKRSLATRVWITADTYVIAWGVSNKNHQF